MKIIFTLLIFTIFVQNSFSQSDFVINKAEAELPGMIQINPSINMVAPVSLPIISIIPEARKSEGETEPKTPFFMSDEKVIATSSIRKLLLPGKHTAFEINPTNAALIDAQETSELTDESETAIMQSPLWIADQLRLKLHELRSHSIITEKQYASLILNASENIKDEVAFVLANMSFQSLTDSRFVGDKEAIVRNAEYIYLYADSLKFVKLVEHGSYNDRTYYTTTKYRIYDPEKKDTVWSEIPFEIYYWYIVHPKMDQEGVYVTDNYNNASGQRTYGYAWREYIWSNPHAEFDYTPVNKTTSKGTISTIPRFGELIQSAKFLWDRNKTYFPFNRPLDPNNSALDLIGNWCSRALPVDVTLPRAFQPNQILMKHDGMCNEDAFLIAATCRTALIPIIYLGTWSEDHVFGAVWDMDWHHFEFFRGGLSPNGNSFYGITNMLPRGSYGWKNAMVQGFRPDGYALNFTEYYANTSIFKIRVLDKAGNPVDGAMLNIFASPSMNQANFLKCGTAFTDVDGYTEFRVGEGKKYLANIYHPVLGNSLVDNTSAFYISQVNTVAGAVYTVNLGYENMLPIKSPTIAANLPPNEGHGVKLNIRTRSVLTGINERDSQKSRFYLWSDDDKGMATAFICDSENYEKYKNGESFEVMSIHKNFATAADLILPVPSSQKSYLVISSYYSTNHYQNVDVEVELLEGLSMSVAEAPKSIIFPNPATDYIEINLARWTPPGRWSPSEIKIFNTLGECVIHLTPTLSEGEGVRIGVSHLSTGVYFMKVGNRIEKFIKF